MDCPKCLTVKVLDIDEQGRVNLTAILLDDKDEKEENETVSE